MVVIMKMDEKDPDRKFIDTDGKADFPGKKRVYTLGK